MKPSRKSAIFSTDHVKRKKQRRRNHVTRILLTIPLIGLMGIASSGPAESKQATKETPRTQIQDERYPTGSALPRAQYVKADPSLKQFEKKVDLSDAATIASQVGRLLRSSLPEGYSLEPGVATRIMAGVGNSLTRSPILGKAPVKSAAPKTIEDLYAIFGQVQMEELQKVATPEELEELIRVLADIHSKKAGLTEQPVSRSLEKWVVTFALQYKRVRLARFSSLLAIIGADGRFLYTRHRNIPDEIDATTPEVEAGQALRVGIKHAEKVFGKDKVVYSEPEVEIWVDGENHGHLAWTFTMSSDSPTGPKSRRYWISAARKPEILDWESRVYATHFGAVTGTAWATTTFEPTASVSLENLQVTRSGSDQVVTGFDGQYGFPAGSGSAQIEATLAGPYSSVVDVSTVPEMARTKTGTPADPLDLNFGASGEFETAQVTAFYWTNRAYHLASEILLPTDLPNLQARVNRGDHCMAWWVPTWSIYPDGIYFSRAGSGQWNCPNTAYSDIIIHEYGHGVDDKKGGLMDDAYSEGFADAMVILETRQPCFGRDFRLGVGTGLPTDLPNLQARVNRGDHCMAWWVPTWSIYPDGIYFSRAGSGQWNCPNTAYSDIIIHEYGHGVDDKKGGLMDDAYSEGFADAMVILETRQPCFGRDFRLGVGTCERLATSPVLWPCSTNPWPFGCKAWVMGRIYQGFTWELIQNLKNTFSEDGAYSIAKKLILAAAVANPADIPDAVLLSFIADDDDGNLANGTPHFRELAAAADSRNIPRPPDPPSADLAYVWANQPTATQYNPDPIFSYNPSGGPITVVRFGFWYVVFFENLTTYGSVGGHAQVTPLGPAHSCQTPLWGPSVWGPLSGFAVLVGCWDAAGNPVNSAFNLTAGY